MPKSKYETDYEYHRRKSDQAWELAGCARRDGDTKEEIRWTEKAREHQRLASEAKRNE